MLTTLFTIAVVALLFGITVFVHEFGHFLAARLCGLVVDAFSIGFGPAIWQRKHKGVTYKIGCIPFGGYVALPQLDPSGTAMVQGSESGAAPGEGEPGDVEPRRHLPPITPWRRIVVSAAGAAGNILLAILLAVAVWIIGKPATPAEKSATVGYVDTQSLAYQAGLRIGDEILSVNGEEVASWIDFLIACSRYPEISLMVRRGETQMDMTIGTEKGLFGEQTLKGVDGRSLCMVLSTEPGMSAERAGIMRGDIITEFNGTEIISRAQLIALVGERKGQTSSIKVRRNNEFVTASVTPDYDPKQDQVRIGVQFNVTDVEFDEIVHPTPWSQLKAHATAIFRSLAALATPGQAGPTARAIGGPVAILINYYYIVRVSLMVAVWFTCFLNVNLAILNVLPIPVLDGGHMLFAVWEMITRRPAHAKVVTWVTNAFAVMLITLFVFLTGRDLWRFTSIGRQLNRWTQTRQGSPAPQSPAAQPADQPNPAPAE